VRLQLYMSFTDMGHYCLEDTVQKRRTRRLQSDGRLRRPPLRRER
jgi:hypothetical protein